MKHENDWTMQTRELFWFIKKNGKTLWDVGLYCTVKLAPTGNFPEFKILLWKLFSK